MNFKMTVMAVCAAVFLAVFPCRTRAEDARSYEARLSQLDYDWGVMACQSGDYESAVKLFRQAIEKNPAYAQAYFRLGYSLAAMGDSEAAMTAYRTLKTLDTVLADKLSVMLGNLRTLGTFKMSVGRKGTAAGRFSEYVE